MNVYLKVYLNYNLGDDLFLKMIVERYPTTNFRAFTIPLYSKIKYTNLYTYSLIINFILKKITRNTLTIEKYLQKKSDICVLIGGSIFMQVTDKSTVVYNNFYNKPYYILGPNFGPYTDSEFIINYRDFFSKSTDICFRDEKSYQMFADIENVRVAPDVIFSLPIYSKKSNTHKNVIFSVIDCNRKKAQIGTEYQNAYIDKLYEMMIHFDALGYTITLMSFCKGEGDEKTIHTLLEKNTVIKNIKTYLYHGDIEEAIEIIDQCNVIVGTRFHANVLGMMLDKAVIPIAYNNKTINFLSDIGYKGIYADLKGISKFDVNSITEEKLSYRCDISHLRKQSDLQFQELDKVLTKG